MDEFMGLFTDYQGSTHLRSQPVQDEETCFNGEFDDIIDYRSPLSDRRDVFRTTPNFKRKQGNERKFGEYSLLLRRIMSQDPNAKPIVQLEIQSDILREAFQKIAAGSVTTNLHHNPIVIGDPYCELYHSREKISAAIQEATSSQLKTELQLLKTFESNYMSTTITDIDILRSRGCITFEFLWSLFPPKAFLVLQNSRASIEPVMSCAVLKKYEVIQKQNSLIWKITVHQLGFDGHKFGNVARSYSFQSFTGLMDITSLPVYPIQHHPDEVSLREELIERGRAYQKLCQGDAESGRKGFGAHRTYSGPLWTPKKPDEDRQGCDFYDVPSAQVCGRCMVDPDGFVNEFPIFRDTIIPEAKDQADDGSSSSTFGFGLNLRSRIYSPADVHSLQQSEEQVLSDNQLLTSPASIPGYSFGTKCWGYFLVDEIKDIDWQEDAFKGLQFDHKKKSIIRSLVSGHSASSTDFDDFISGKGRGLVFLLHGPPGSGKTMTAESVAESLHRPLYYISGGELGTQLYKIEDCLRVIFDRIVRWEAVLLFDEADTYMAKRREDSIQRNAMISILLRLLEYQSGIIFLTTNRITDFDPAFHSRIHITIPYSQPTQEQRQFIWHDLSSKSENTFSDADFKRLAELPLNGRNVKNVLRVASLSVRTKEDGKKEKVGFTHVKEVLPIAFGDATDPKLSEAVREFLERS
ncbi:hypothetical protein GP486_005306 [Trichoglossum hirsutum]|uniref:AAA+ ATPase domain-containing protein n=1 Tax=Trichoglossum hirsutum TaxID=265104 RepID=A0A9P8L9D7_9PEZI|nr:hypothetical protein GP486_005306 [Trichoglossum hirsutum]